MVLLIGLGVIVLLLIALRTSAKRWRRVERDMLTPPADLRREDDWSTDQRLDFQDPGLLYRPTPRDQ